MRIIVVPILRGNWGFFCHSTHPPTGRIAKWVAWSAVKWEDLGKEPAGTMKKKLHIYGTKLIDQVDHEERFLKIVPTKEEVTDKQLLVPVHYPSALRLCDVSRHFRKHIEERKAHHKRYLFYSVLWLPLTGAFTVVPVIPNVPFFYNVFRLYSHYKAFKGAEHLLHLSDEGRISFKAEAFLNCAVKRRDPGRAAHSVATDGQTGKEGADLRRQALDDSCLLHIAQVFRELAPTLGLELEQARAQVIQRERETSAESEGGRRKPRRKNAARNVVRHDVETFEDEGRRSVEEQSKGAARVV